MKIFLDSDNDNAWQGLILFWTVTVIVIVVALGYSSDKYFICPNLGSSLEKQTKYNFMAGGCFIRLSDGTWISSDNYSGVNLENK